jgi:hypothetical protein
MKKLFTVLVAFGALVAVTAATAASPTVTINVSNRTVVYGGTPNLNGTTDPNSTVTITANPQDEASWSTTVKAGSDGVWQLKVAPWVQTSYTATVGGATSDPTIIFVKPRVQLLKKGPGGRYQVIISAGRSFVGQQVLLGKQVLTKSRATRHWVYVKKITMSSNVKTDGTTVARFVYKAARGSHLKIFLPGATAQKLGYQGVTSNFIVV